MKCLSKKILCFIICGFLTFSITSTVYYKSVHAMEWVGGALAFEEALKWLLAAIGITATAGMTDAYWDSYGDDFTYYAIENGATQTEVAEWQLKACQGIIDKGSVVWQKFKDWSYSLVNGSGDSSFPVNLTVSNIVNYLLSYYGLSHSVNLNGMGNYNIIAFDAHTYFSGTEISAKLCITNGSYYYTNGQIKCSSGNFQYILFDGSSVSSNIQSVGGYGGFGSDAIGYNIAGWPYTLVGGGAVSDSNFESSVSNVDDLDVISSDGVDEDNPEVTIPMPGVSDSDNEASKDAYQDIIDAINDGTITQEQGVEQIQEILKIVTYDTVTDKVVPPQQNEDGTDKTKDDALKENKENMGFTLGGLEAVFPFCIPFDIYAFMTLLVAEPDCPEFDFPIKSVNGQVEEIHVDLEPFEPVAVVVRYVFDFLFIIGLAMLTRSLIGGGSSD